MYTLLIYIERLLIKYERTFYKTYIRFVYLAVYQCITKRTFILSIKVSQNVRSYFIKSLSMYINKVYMYDVSYLSVDL
jgi:hypothetical protein